MITRKFSKKSSLAVLTASAAVALVGWAVLGLPGGALADHKPGHKPPGGGGGGGDTTPPAAVTDLAVDLGATTHNSITLTWTATADDGNDPLSGPASLYEVRYSLNDPDQPPFSGDREAWFTAAIQPRDEPTPKPPGSAETFTVRGLPGDTAYFLALKVADEVQNATNERNWSELSNVVSETTPPTPPGEWSIEIVPDSRFNDHIYYQGNALAYDPVGNLVIAYVYDERFFTPPLVA